jgi:Dna[CI] antecedent, DciA
VVDPERVSDLLKGIIRDVKAESSRSDLASALEQVLGPEQSPHCQVTGFRSGKLTVEVDSAPLFAELSGFRRDEIRERMNELLTKKQVAQITFRMGGTGHV